jgi:hypothetical protein
MLKSGFVCLLVISFISVFAQTEKECRTNLEMDAFFEKKQLPPDTTVKKRPATDTTPKQGQGITPSGFICPAGTNPLLQYRLRIGDDAFTVISFTIIAETQDDDIAEVVNYGEYLQTSSLRIIGYRKKHEPVYLSCIKVRHSSGVIRIVKPLTVDPTTL